MGSFIYIETNHFLVPAAQAQAMAAPAIRPHNWNEPLSTEQAQSIVEKLIPALVNGIGSTSNAIPAPTVQILPARTLPTVNLTAGGISGVVYQDHFTPTYTTGYIQAPLYQRVDYPATPIPPPSRTGEFYPFQEVHTPFAYQNLPVGIANVRSAAVLEDQLIERYGGGIHRLQNSSRVAGIGTGYGPAEFDLANSIGVNRGLGLSPTDPLDRYPRQGINGTGGNSGGTSPFSYHPNTHAHVIDEASPQFQVADILRQDVGITNGASTYNRRTVGDGVDDLPSLLSNFRISGGPSYHPPGAGFVGSGTGRTPVSAGSGGFASQQTSTTESGIRF